MKPWLIGLLLACGSISSAQRSQTYTGRIADSECGADGHAVMRMGPTDAECTRMCVLAHGAQFVLVDGKTVYKLSDQTAPDKLAGQRVKVVGVLDAKTQTIAVTSMSPID